MKYFKLTIELLWLLLYNCKLTGEEYEVKLELKGEEGYITSCVERISKLEGGKYALGGRIMGRESIKKKMSECMDDLERRLFLRDILSAYGYGNRKYSGKDGMSWYGLFMFGKIRSVLEGVLVEEVYRGAYSKRVILEGVQYEKLKPEMGREAVVEELIRMRKIEPLKVVLKIIMLLYWWRVRSVRYMTFFDRLSVRVMYGVRCALWKGRMSEKMGETIVESMGWKVKVYGDIVYATKGMFYYRVEREKVEGYKMDGGKYNIYDLVLYLERVRDGVMVERMERRKSVMEKIMKYLDDGSKCKEVRGVKQKMGVFVYEERYAINYIGCGESEEKNVKNYDLMKEELLGGLLGKMGVSEYWRIRFSGNICFSKRCYVPWCRGVVWYVIWCIYGILRVIGYIWYNGYELRVNCVYIILRIEYLVRVVGVTFWNYGILNMLRYGQDCLFLKIESLIFKMYMMSIHQCRLVWLKFRYERLRGKFVKRLREREGLVYGEKNKLENIGGNKDVMVENDIGWYFREKEEKEGEDEEKLLYDMLDIEDYMGDEVEVCDKKGEYNIGAELGRDVENYRSILRGRYKERGRERKRHGGYLRGLYKIRNAEEANNSSKRMNVIRQQR
jgi:hypothetical protein